MKLFLTSLSSKSKKRNGETVSRKFLKSNSFFKNVKKSVKNYDTFVWVCNAPNGYPDFADNDAKAELVFKMIEKQLHHFEHYIVLDNRNKNDAQEILSHADLIQVNGGKIPEQNKFLKDIKFLQNIKQNDDSVVICISAGTMNMCSSVFNFPEDDNEIDDKKWYTGLGLFNQIIIPHFDRKKGYAGPTGSFDIMKDYFLPYSENRTLLALTNGAYIAIDEGDVTLYGETYTISNGQIKQVCKNKKHIKLQ